MEVTTAVLAETYPQTATQISDAWWDLVFNGSVWRLKLTDLPFPVPILQTFRMTCIRKADSRRVKASLRFSSDGSVAFIQGRGRTPTGDWEPRKPLERALDAPPVPPITQRYEDVVVATPGTPRRMSPDQAAIAQLPLPDFSDSIARMTRDREEQGLDQVQVYPMLQHPVLGWAFQRCDCDTMDFRIHPTSCPTYRLLGLIEHHLRRLPEAPEVWARRMNLAM